jgi:hypothetical protein
MPKTNLASMSVDALLKLRDDARSLPRSLISNCKLGHAPNDRGIKCKEMTIYIR